MRLLPEGTFNLAEDCLRFSDDRAALRRLGAQGEEEIWTYARLRADSARFANMLQNMGVSRGDVVFLLLSTCPEVWVGMLGALRYGAAVGLLSPGAETETWRRTLAGTAAKLLVLEPSSKPAIDSMRKDLPELWHVLVLRRAREEVRMSGGDFLWEDYVTPAAPRFPSAPCLPETPAIIGEEREPLGFVAFGHGAGLRLERFSNVGGGDPLSLLAPLVRGTTQVASANPSEAPSPAADFAGISIVGFRRGRHWVGA